MNKRLFVDINGTLAHFNKVQKIEVLYEQGYFLSLPPYQNVIDAIKTINKRPDVDVFILAYDILDAECTFCLYMKDTDKLEKTVLNRLIEKKLRAQISVLILRIQTQLPRGNSKSNH